MAQSEAQGGLFQGRKTLSLMPTFACPAACANCATLSHPQERTNLNLETILEAICQARELGDFAEVVFTGGETTLRWRDLLQALSYAHTLGFRTRVVTNVYWASSLEKARGRVDELISAGLSEINYSTGDEHVHFIPLESVIHATVAAAEGNLKTLVIVELKAEQKINKDEISNHPMMASLTPEQTKMIQIVESPWMPLNPWLAENYPAGTAINKENLAAHTGCDTILQTYTVQADGRIGSCCGVGLRTIRELNVAVAEGSEFLKKAVEEAESDFLKLWLRFTGPEKILAWAAEHNPEIKWENMYAHRCQACQRIYKDPQVIKVIREHYTEALSEITQRA